MIEKITSVLTRIFGSKSDRDIKQILPFVEQIKEHESSIRELTDDELKGKTDSYRERLREATAEVDEQIGDIKRKMDSNDESVSLEERRELADDLDALQEEWLEIVEEVLDDILPEA